MTIDTRKLLKAGGIAILAASISGCMSSGGGGGRQRAAETGVEGTWMDTTGGQSTLSGGIFKTVSVETGNTLSEGSYTKTGSDSVSIVGTSMIRKAKNLPSEISFNCLLADQHQLNCTSSTGATFVLTRRVATPV